MMKIINSRDFDREPLADLSANAAIEARVSEILAAVRAEGDAALRRYTERFDGVALDAIELPEEAIDRAWEATDPDFRETLKQAAANILAYHQNQKKPGFVMADKPGVVMGQRVLPLERVGLYVPGGTAAYPSTVLMDAIPAVVAGVKELCIATPPLSDGSVNPDVLAAAKVAGVRRVFRMGGAQAIAALAYGTESVPRMDKIVGPGNIYVATAKRQVFGLVDIDMVAGPSEILIVADGDCNAETLAADLLSQAEHDPLAIATLVTPCRALAEAVVKAVERQIPLLERADICRASIDANGRAIVVADLAEAMRISNRIAPEHLELSVDDPFALLPLVQNAGSVFLGRNVPEAMGDYFAGANHTLPTGGTARFSSPLSVDDFVKKSSYIYYDETALKAVGARVAAFARREGLTAHARSIEMRLEGEDQA
ncbi:MAG: histidinol dehydrogenase [Oscillospiraceae bacterium]|jgi:histidinol dehydrogenase|nr:histidinol dehydrogenase [Oscillospiraceae bacterium]